MASSKDKVANGSTDKNGSRAANGAANGTEASGCPMGYGESAASSGQKELSYHTYLHVCINTI